ncbi:MAG: patatin-like phospholipase family protein, partial [Inquilinus sp.]|nr:patatin-like phospholipase family protein [Inquilinus sp.]
MAERKTHKGRASKKAAPAGRVVNLALQGGGSHGAYTWGVLDRLLEDGRLSFEGISGTSAGAINGALLICGLAKGGPDGARALLEELWTRVGEQAAFAPFQPTWADRLTNNPNLDNSPAYIAFDMMLRLASPYQFNPLDYNPLRGLLTGMIQPIETLHASDPPRLYVSATDVLNGRLKVFEGEELSVEALIASACLPFLFQAVQIKGNAYWDGGYMGNPTLYPLIHSCEARDIVVVQINPIH